ncbi:MAG: hypothetical protein E6G03_00980 [Actinobacteria bacterium]|nr:MAG: hypothetical protein E6G03_00980 [Actinomycetota bacterium]
MTRALIIVAIAIGAVSLYVTTAPAGQQAVTPKQFAALTKRVTKLEKDNKLLLGFAGIVATCLDQAALPTTKAPAYHVPATGEATDFYVLGTTNLDCVNVLNAPALKNLRARLGR